MSLEIKKKELEYKRIEMALFEREFKIEERIQEIERLKNENEISRDKLNELEKEINLLKE